MVSHRSKLLLACISGIILGILAVIYGFELVSAPRVKEYHELIWVLGGLTLVIVCTAGLLWKARKGRTQPGKSQP